MCTRTWLCRLALLDGTFDDGSDPLERPIGALAGMALECVDQSGGDERTEAERNNEDLSGSEEAEQDRENAENAERSDRK